MAKNSNLRFNIINLSKRIDRFQEMQQELKAAKIKNFRFVSGIDASEISASFERTFFFNRPEIKACSMSHRKALLFDGFVLEDDLQFCSDFLQRLDQFLLLDIPKNWDIAYLGFTPNLQSEYLNIGKNVIKLQENCTGAWGYYARGEAKKKLYNYLERMSPDAALSTLQEEGANCYSAYPFLARVKEGYSDTSLEHVKFPQIDINFKP